MLPEVLVIYIDDEGQSEVQHCENERDGVEFAEYLNRLHFPFIAVHVNEREVVRFEN